jgi:hypothetical protein
MLDYFEPYQLNMEPAALVAHGRPRKNQTMKPFTFCKDVGSGIPDSAWNDFSVFGNRELMKPELIANHKVRLFQAPAHGRVVFSDEARSPVGYTDTAFKSSGLIYLPTLDYAGKDRAVFLVEANNKQYQVTVNFWVMLFVTDENVGDTYCRAQKFGVTADASQDVYAWLANANLSSFLSAASGAEYTDSDHSVTSTGTAAAAIKTAAIAVHGSFDKTVVAQCQVIPIQAKGDELTAINHLSPAAAAASRYSKNSRELSEYSRSAKVTVAVAPKHGVIHSVMLAPDAGGYLIYVYEPKVGFSGFDGTTFIVTLQNGKHVLVTMPVEVGGDERFPPAECPIALPRVIPNSRVSPI